MLIGLTRRWLYHVGLSSLWVQLQSLEKVRHRVEGCVVHRVQIAFPLQLLLQQLPLQANSSVRQYTYGGRPKNQTA